MPSGKGKGFEKSKDSFSPDLQEVNQPNEPWVYGHGMSEIRDIILKQLSRYASIQETPEVLYPSIDKNWDYLSPTPWASSLDSEANRFILHTAHFHIRWALREFLEQQFGTSSVPSLGSVIALTGSAIAAQATTVKDYLNKNWPKSTKLLQLLEKDFSSSGNTGKTKGQLL
jgi:hypothetical protein